MTLSAEHIDWSATWAGFSALVAGGVAGWTAWWSSVQMRRNELNERARARLEWISRFRSDLSDFIAHASLSRMRWVQGKAQETPDDRALKFTSLYHCLMMNLPIGPPHFDGLRAAVGDLFNGDTAMDLTKFNTVVVNLQFVGLAALETEKILALRELGGRRLR